uniref:Uncharacterized protein n=1 Tax=Vibrio sp. FF_307 TaxID=1652834 RepID=A0A0H4A304_9VIBR|nr:hypothetical protein [Vibrio sp. FF_307]
MCRYLQHKSKTTPKQSALLSQSSYLLYFFVGHNTTQVAIAMLSNSNTAKRTDFIENQASSMITGIYLRLKKNRK